MDKVGGFWIEGACRFICKEKERLLGNLPGKNHSLFFTSGQVSCDMHHPVRKPYLVEEIRGPVDRFLLGIFNIIKGMKHILDNPVIPVEGKRPLEHDGGMGHEPAPHIIGRFIPEVNVGLSQIRPTLRTCSPGHAPHTKVRAVITHRDMVDDAT